MPEINYDVWIQGEPAYTGLNTRTGSAAITDQDFDDFAPFTLAYYPTGANKYTLWNWLNGGELSLDNEIDKSMCYVGMYNSDLPQLNIAAYSFDTYDTLDNPLYKTDNSQIQSYFCYDTWNFMFQQTQIPNNSRLYGDGRIYDKDFTYISNKMQIYKDGTVGAQPHISPSATTNLHDWLNVYLSFGVKSLILEINVVYKTGEGTFYPDQARSTLAAYAAQTTAWKEAHTILQAYCIPYIRGNTNGTYSNTGREFETYNCNQTFTPAFTLPYISQNNDYPDIVTYTTTLADGQSTRNGYFPLYGVMVGELTLSSSSTAVQNMGILVPLMGTNKGTLGKRQSSGYMYYWLELDGSDDDNIEWLRRAAAAYGLFFCDSIGTLANSGRDIDRWIDNSMCLGTIDENGRTNGDYTRGLQNMLQRQFDWSDSTESPFDPDTPPPPPSPYDTHTVFNDIGNIASLTRRYALTAAAVEELGSELWEISADLINNIQNDEWNKYTAEVLDTFLVNDPLSCIVSLQKYPMRLPEQSGPVHVKLGKAETNIEANITSATTHTYAFTPQLIQPKYGNSFLDYEPYTHMELYVPFCGTISLDPRDYLGHYLNIRLVVDFTTGTCVAYVMSDDLVIDTVNGSLAVSIPVTGIDSTTLAANITNGIINTRNARYSHIFGTLGKAASPRGILSNISNVWGSAETILSSEENARAAEYSLSHQTAPPHTIGSASPIGSWAIDFSARLLIYYPTGEVIDNSKEFLAFNDEVLFRYMDQVGIATIDPVENVGTKYRGLIAATAPVLENMVTAAGEPATDPELQLIARALEEGIII